jgi:hypothetical protein
MCGNIKTIIYINGENITKLICNQIKWRMVSSNATKAAKQNEEHDSRDSPLGPTSTDQTFTNGRIGPSHTVD